MQNIIGQEKLVNKLKRLYFYFNAQKHYYLIGESGCGKHFISDKFSKYLGIDLVEITAQTTAEELIEYYQSSLPRIYLINLSNFVEKQQHKFLKFIEEPSNMRVILTAESEVGILPTILNRCIKYIFEDYSIEQLKQLNWILTEENELIYKICKTPGQLLTLASVDNLDQIQLTCEYLVKNIVGMPYLACINLSL